jgi:hypothetical protein
MTYAHSVKSDNTVDKLKHMCSECAIKMGDMEFEARIEVDGALHMCQPVIGDVDEDDWPRGHLEDGISPNYALRLKMRREQNKPTAKQSYDLDDDLSGKYTVDYSDDKTLDALMYDEVTFDDGVSWI